MKDTSSVLLTMNSSPTHPGRLTDYWRKGLNTSEPESLASIALKGDPDLSPEEELSSVPKNIDSLKLVDAD